MLIEIAFLVTMYVIIEPLMNPSQDKTEQIVCEENHTEGCENVN